jgi:hypothetical protein
MEATGRVHLPTKMPSKATGRGDGTDQLHWRLPVALLAESEVVPVEHDWRSRVWREERDDEIEIYRFGETFAEIMRRDGWV